MYDTATKEGQLGRLTEIVRDYTTKHAWEDLARLIGGSPRHDLQDYTDADAGEEPKGAVEY